MLQNQVLNDRVRWGLISCSVVSNGSSYEPNYEDDDDNEYGTLVEWWLPEETKVLGETPVPLTICPKAWDSPQITTFSTAWLQCKFFWTAGNSLFTLSILFVIYQMSQHAAATVTSPSHYQYNATFHTTTIQVLYTKYRPHKVQCNCPMFQPLNELQHTRLYHYYISWSK